MTIEYKGHKIFAFADTHGMYRRLQVSVGADVLICAGMPVRDSIPTS